MVLQSSGEISLLDIQNEFGGDKPIGMDEYYTDSSSGYTNGIIDIPSSDSSISLNVFYNKSKIVVEEDFVYTTVGTYTFTVPSNVNKICVLCIGGGGGGGNTSNDGAGGAGGGLIWVNDIVVTTGETFTVTVGSGGTIGVNGGNSSFSSTDVSIIAYGGLSGNGTQGRAGGSKEYTINRNFGTQGGGNGGSGGHGSIYLGTNLTAGGGGGAAGYTGNGGSGGVYKSSVTKSNGSDGVGGGGGGGGAANTNGSGGGGVGIYGQGSNGTGATSTNASYSNGGGGGSGGTSGTAGSTDSTSGSGGLYGGGAGGRDDSGSIGPGGHGAVRIMCTETRSFPLNAAAPA